jgi:hypothetical protein
VTAGWSRRSTRSPRAAGQNQSPRRPWARWTAHAIDRRDRDLLASCVSRIVLDIDGFGPTLFCHGSPRDDEEPLTALTPERRWRAALEDVGQSVVVCGHTHIQFDRQLGPWRVVNAGAVGLPYEGRVGAYWLLLGPGVEHRRSDYDLDRAVAWGMTLDDQALSAQTGPPHVLAAGCRSEQYAQPRDAPDCPLPVDAHINSPAAPIGW